MSRCVAVAGVFDVSPLWICEAVDRLQFSVWRSSCGLSVVEVYAVAFGYSTGGLCTGRVSRCGLRRGGGDLCWSPRYLATSEGPFGVAFNFETPFARISHLDLALRGGFSIFNAASTFIMQ